MQDLCADPQPDVTGQPRLRRALGLWAVTISGVGIVLGAGIYVLIGEAAADAGSATWMAFLAAALLAGATGLSFAELSSMFPEAGASAAYAEEAFGQRTGFVTGWLDVLVNVVGAAAVALGFGGYVSSLFGWNARLVALGAILLCAFVIYVGVRETVGLAVAFALIEVVGLAIVVAVGLPAVGNVSVLDAPLGLTGVLVAAALVFFAYEGFEEIASLAEEAKDPSRTIPRAILLAIGITSLFYVIVAIVAVSVVPWQRLAESSAPLALVAEVAASRRLGDALSVIALFATFNTVLLLLATGARLTYGMANRRLLPRFLGRVSGRRRTPWIATVLLALIAIAFALSGNIRYVAQVTNFAVFGQFLVVNGAVLMMRWSRPAQGRPFRIPANVGTFPASALLGVAGTILFATFMDRGALATGAIALVAGIALSFVMLRRRVRDAGAGTAGSAGDP